MRKKMLYQSAVAAAIGMVATVLFCLIIDREVVGGVAIVAAPLFFVSVVLVFILEAVSANNAVKLAAFVSPLILVVGATAYAMWVDAQAIKNTGVSDGSGDVARFMLKAYLVGLAIAFVCLVALAQRSGRP
jgi:hypothetical protein